MDTPLFDVLLADRLATASRAVAQAATDATAFRAALDRGQTQALEQLAEQQARALVVERTREFTEQVRVLEQRLQHAQEQTVAARAELAELHDAALPQPVPTAPPAPPIVVADPPSKPAAALPRAAGRKAADQGPTGGDVPVVPSVKEILTTTRSASWLDTLLGSRR